MVEQRPAYHFIPTAYWINDPNGPIQWKGVYHLFYQHNPREAWWGNMHWGHARSTDLVHWEHLPIALAPGPDEWDSDGIWSGCCVDRDGVPAILYTGHPSQTQCLALGSDDLITWAKHSGNPVIPAAPQGMQTTGFRDPFAWREDGGWYCVVGSGIEGVGGTALLYRSADLVSWDYVGPLCIGDKDETGVMWECPSFFPLGDKHVLVVSPYGKVLQMVGTYADHKLTVERTAPLDLSPVYYAPNCFVDDTGRRIMWGWIQERRTEEDQKRSGWAGAMSLPRLVTPGADGLVSFAPAEELQALRDKHVRLGDLEIAPKAERPAPNVTGDCLEIVAEIDPGDATAVGIRVRCSPGGEEQTLISYDADAAMLAVERQGSTLAPDADLAMHGDDFRLGDGETLKLHVFLDRSVIEVFANGGKALTTRVYPTREDSLGVGFFACGGTARLISLDAWTLRPIW